MLTVGDKFPAFNLKATVSTESVEKAFSPDQQRHLQGQVAAGVFLSEGFHLRLPDRNQGFR
jgi:peroxiredoxin (alkyl hydroperoxide reductase subunit C)